MKKLSWFNKFMLVATVILATLLVFSSFSALIEPEDSKYIYLLGLGYPAFVLLNLLLFVYWMRKKKWMLMLLPLVSVWITYGNLKTMFAFRLSNTQKQESDFTVLSFNVRRFNEYHWLEEDKVDEKIFAYIQEKSPDIVAIQEFINRGKTNLRYIEKMHKLGYPYYSLEPGRYIEDKQSYFGLAIFSKYPILQDGVVFQYQHKNGFPLKAVCIFTDIKLNHKVIRIYNTHLQSLKFKTDDYQFVENIHNNNKETLSKSKGIASKVLKAAYKRAKETKVIAQHVKFSKYPVILAGDFNEPPYTYAYKQLTQYAVDSFLEHGFGMGTTFDGIATIPGLRLDFILHSRSLVSTHFQTGPSGLSDHRPLFGSFAFPK